MNAKAILKAGLLNRRSTAALAQADACSQFSARSYGACGGDLAMVAKQAVPTRTSFDHDCLHEIGRTLAENGEHSAHIVALDIKRPAEKTGTAQFGALLAERVKELKPCWTGGRSSTGWIVSEPRGLAVTVRSLPILVGERNALLCA